MNDCQFFVNKDKRAVTCIYYNKNIWGAVDFVDRDYYYKSKFALARRYVGVARCNPDDNWNEDIGRLVAYTRMKNSYFKDFFIRTKKIYEEMEKILNEEYYACNKLGDKFANELDRLDELIRKRVEANGSSN